MPDLPMKGMLAALAGLVPALAAPDEAGGKA